MCGCKFQVYGMLEWRKFLIGCTNIHIVICKQLLFMYKNISCVSFVFKYVVFIYKQNLYELPCILFNIQNQIKNIESM